MKVLKVLHRTPDPPQGNYGRPPNTLWSAIPAPSGLQYFEGKKTVPTTGKVMVYLASQKHTAEQFCKTAARWYEDEYDYTDRGSIEVWSAECHNLHRIDFLMEVSSLRWDGPNEMRPRLLHHFWEDVLHGMNPLHRPFMRHMAKGSIHGVWTTDWVIPLERLAIFQIGNNGRQGYWPQKLEED